MRRVSALDGLKTLLALFLIMKRSLAACSVKKSPFTVIAAAGEIMPCMLRDVAPRDLPRPPRFQSLMSLPDYFRDSVFTQVSGRTTL